MKRRSLTRARARELFVLAAMVSCCIAFIGCLGGSGSSDGPSVGSSNSSSVDSSSGTTYANSRESRQSDFDSSQPEARVLDLNNQDDRRLLNSFISDFSKVWGRGKTFKVESATTDDFLSFATAFVGIEQNDAVEHQPNNGLYQVDGEGIGALEGFRMRVNADLVSRLIQEHFGVDVNYAEASAPQLHERQYQDGYVYFGGAEGSTVKSLALCTSLESLGGGEYSVSVNVYDAVPARYAPGDSSYYALTQDELESNPVLEGTYSPGTVVVKNRGDGSLQLKSYEVRSSSNRVTRSAANPGNTGESSPGAPVSIASGDEACEYVKDRLAACGKVAPPYVECIGNTDRGYRVRGYRMADQQNSVTVFLYDVRVDGTIYHETLQTMINPETMEKY